MKKILALTKAYYPHLGGVETIAQTIAEGALSRGYQTTVLCFGEGPEEGEVHGIKVRRIRPAFSLGSAPLSGEYLEAFRKLAPQADLIHIHSPNPGGEIAWLLAPRAIKERVPALCTYQGDPVRPRLAAPPYIALLRQFLARCSCVVTSSPPLLNSSKALKKERNRCTLIPLGVPAERFATQEKIPPCRKKKIDRLVKGLPRPRGLFAGRFVYYKGLEVLLNAAVRVPHLSLLLVGTGPLETRLKARAHKLGLDKRIRFIPPLEEELYPHIFSRCDFFVFPSVSPSEAFGLTLAEALASGLPCISTELGTGTSYVNRHSTTGLVVPPKDPKALAEAMHYLLSHPEEATLMGQQGARRARNLFDQNQMVDRYCRLYERLTEHPRQP